MTNMTTNNKEKRKRIKVSGWIEDNVKDSNIPTICPKCGSKLRVVNALQTGAKIMFIYCTNLKCRYAEEFEE
jgi:ssDNA-binding Zn-finger/Zn-ribbon topoisomerase 1